MIMFDEEDAQTLVKLGFTLSQARIYLALITLGVASAKKIAQIAGIDRGETYRQLDILHKKVIVEKILKVPNEYKPFPLNVVLKRVIEKKDKEDHKIRQKIGELLEKEQNRKKLKEEPSKISIITEGYANEHLPKRYEYLQKEQLLYTQIESLPSAINLWSKVFEKAFARGVRLRIIAELNEPTNAILKLVQSYAKKNPNFVIRFVNPTLLTTFTIFDNEDTAIFMKKKPAVGAQQVLGTTNPVLVEVMKDYFELRWKNAMKEYPTKAAHS